MLSLSAQDSFRYNIVHNTGQLEGCAPRIKLFDHQMLVHMYYVTGTKVRDETPDLCSKI